MVDIYNVQAFRSHVYQLGRMWLAWTAVFLLALALGLVLSLPVLAGITGIATGPVGPIGAGLLGLLTRGASDEALLQQWYDRISLATMMFSRTPRIVLGRRNDRSQTSSPVFRSRQHH